MVGHRWPSAGHLDPSITVMPIDIAGAEDIVFGVPASPASSGGNAAPVLSSRSERRSDEDKAFEPAT